MLPVISCIKVSSYLSSSLSLPDFFSSSSPLLSSSFPFTDIFSPSTKRLQKQILKAREYYKEGMISFWLYKENKLNKHCINKNSNINCMYILPCVRGSMTNNNRSWIGWLDLLALLLKSLLITITTAHNWWLPKTRSIPSWTTSIFSSIVRDLVLIYKSVTSSASVVHWLTLHSWTLNHNCNLTDWLLVYDSMTTDLQMLNELTNELSFITSDEPKRDHHLQQFMYSAVYPLPQECAFGEPLASNGLPHPLVAAGTRVSEPLYSNGRFVFLNYSAFQPSCHNIKLHLWTYFATPHNMKTLLE
jgi:hypothetical protein